MTAKKSALPTSVRFEKQLLADLRQAALEEKRPLAWLINNICQQYVDARKKHLKAKK